MTTFGANWRIVFLIGVVAAVFFCAPGSSQAGCGDYVHFGNEAAPEVNSLALPEFPSAGLPIPACPCRGPKCSRGTPTPIVPPARQAPPHTDDWAFSLRGINSAFHSTDSVLIAILPTESNRSCQSIFHPPR
jgi:hypothetical protein